MTNSNLEPNPNSEFYVAGGTMSAKARSYLSRKADEDLFEGLKARKFCYVLTSRQMGKSSLMVRVASKLKTQGFEVVILDLTKIGQNLTPEQWYNGIQLQVGEWLHLEDEMEEFWLANERLGQGDGERLGPLQLWMKAMREVVLEKCKKPIMIFIDEVDVVHSLSFSTREFFAGIRAFYNSRNEDPELNRLNFCLIGVTTTADLIKDVNTTPLNVGGRRIELADFTEDDITPLTANLGRDEKTNKQLLKRILYWTGGHPYLTQRFCKEVAEKTDIRSTNGIDSLCNTLFLSRGARDSEDNLVFVRNRMLDSDEDTTGLLLLYSRIHKGKKVPNDNLNPFVKTLHLSGITRPTDDGNLTIRNRIYQKVFDQKWVENNLPGAEVRKQREQDRNRLIQLAVAALVIITVLGASTGLAVWQYRKADKALTELGVTQDSLDETKRALDQREKVLGVTQDSLDATKRALDQRGKDLDKANKDLAIKQNEIERQTSIANEKSTEAIRQKAEAVKALAALDKTKRDLDERQVQLDAQRATNREQAEVLVKSKEQIEQQRLTAKQLTEKANEQQAEALRQQQIAKDEKENSDRLRLTAKQLTEEAHKQQAEALRQQQIANDEKENSERLMYAAQIKEAANVYEEGNVNLLRTILNETDHKRRGVEWNYLNHLNEGLVPFDLNKEDGIDHPVFSPDGKYLVTTGSTSPLLVWDLQTGKKKGIVVSENEQKAKVSDFTFSPDGKWLVACEQGSKLVLWNTSISSWEKQPIPLNKQSGPFEDEVYEFVSFNPDNNLLLVVSNRKGNHFLQSWDVQEKTQIGSAKPIQIGKGRLEGFAFKGQLYINYDGVNPNTQFPTYEPSLMNAELQVNRLYSLPAANGVDNFHDFKHAFSSDGSMMAIATASHIYIASISDRTELIDLERLSSPREWIDIALSQNGELLAALDNSSVCIWNTHERKRVRIIPIASNIAKSIAFSPKGATLAVGGFDQEGYDGSILTVLDAEHGADVFTFSNQKPLAFSRDSSKVVTLERVQTSNSEEDRLNLWDSTNRKSIRLVTDYFPAHPHVSFSADGNYLFAEPFYEGPNRAGPSLRLWNSLSGKEVKLMPTAECKLLMDASAFLADGKSIGAICQDDTLRVWRTETGEELYKIETKKGFANSLREFLDKGGRIQVIQTENSFVILNPAEEILGIWDINKGIQSLAVCGEKILKLSPDGKWMITHDRRDNYRLRDTINRDCNVKTNVKRLLFGGDLVKEVVFSNDSKYLALSYTVLGTGITESVDFMLVDLTSGKSIFSDSVSVIEDQYAKSDVQFSPLVRWVQFGDEYYNINTSKTVKIKGSCAVSPTFSIDEKRLITRCGDGNIKLRDLESGLEVLRVKVHDSNVNNVIITRDNRFMLTNTENEVKLWRMQF